MNIPEEAVEAAAGAAANSRRGITAKVNDTDRMVARAALEAAAPLLMAQALRETARDLSWFGAQGNTVEPNTAWAGVQACMNALNYKADEMEGKS